MGGKSTYMRQTALIALLAHTGSDVPAQEAIIGDIDRIFSRIGAQDDLSTGQSTFMVEMLETANILHHSTDKSLVLLDEVGRGTSTYDGLALAWAIANELGSCIHAYTLFATHYFELTDLTQESNSILNVHLDAVEHFDKRLDPTITGKCDQDELCVVVWMFTRIKPNFSIADLKAVSWKDLWQKYENAALRLKD